MRASPLVAIALLAPAPSLGIAAALIVAPGPVGQAVFTACKLWLLIFPLVWWMRVEGGRPKIALPRGKAVAAGLVTGLVGAAAIVFTYFFLAAERIDPDILRAAIVEMGIGSPATFLLGAAYWIFVNSLIEEYVFRWFLVRQAEQLVAPAWAVIISAVIFTVHHVIALMAFLEPGLTALASTGIFIGAVCWSWLFLRYRSIWPCWISHALIDAPIFAIGYVVVFG